MSEQYRVDLTAAEQEYRSGVRKPGKAAARKIARAPRLLQAAEGQRDEELAALVWGGGRATLPRTRQRVGEDGGVPALSERRRASGRSKLEGKPAALWVVRACRLPPAGRARGTLQLGAERVVELTAGAGISAETGRRARRETRKLRTYLGRVLRNVERGQLKLSAKQTQGVRVARRILAQPRTDHGKVYSVHAPEVECIAKGKVPKHYEFGCKVRIVTTSGRGGIVGIDAEHGNPYEGATLQPALAQVKRVTGVRPQEAFVDKGFRGQRYHPKAVAVDIAGRRNLTPQLSKLLKRRSAIEPVIGHTKHDHGMNRNYLLGKIGDRINALLSGCAWNLKKLWRHFVDHPLPVPAT